MYPMGAVVMNDADEIGAKTWADIVGAANVVDKRIVNGAVTSAVKAMSVDGMTLGSMQTATMEPVADGTQEVTDISYKGIAGTVFCNGSNCMVEAVEDADGDAITNMRKLVGSWYFTPTLPNELWVAGATAGTYAVATQYARYGYWLAFDDQTGAATLNTYAASGSILTASSPANTDNLNLGVDSDGNSVTASYTGGAVGISVTTDADDDPVASGRFDADVNLTARFGATPTLGGNITNFRGNAVNSNWNVTLNQTELDAAGDLTGDNGIAYGGAAAGQWTAQGYGPVQTPEDTSTDPATPAVSHRPDGFYGRFNANFTDGMAAGAYTTRD